LGFESLPRATLAHYCGGALVSRQEIDVVLRLPGGEPLKARDLTIKAHSGGPVQVLTLVGER
jgi:hypothetical protein